MDTGKIKRTKIQMTQHGWNKQPNKLPHNWKALREIIAERAGYQCQDTMRDGTRCPDKGTECDHIVNIRAGGTHDIDNLQWLCQWHHKRKTSKESQEARIAVSMWRKPETHPGYK
jgi:5-methylcytosine-specific restriction protein A